MTEREYLELVALANRYAYQYYVLDEPIVSDAEYDHVYDEIVRYESATGISAQDSPTHRVGGEPIKEFGTHTHLSKLYSLDKAQTYDELRDWYNKLPTHPEVALEYKLDGLTLCLTYQNGFFLRATTRGNGETGEDVTAQVLTIKSIPLKISYTGTLEVQGEGIMRLSKFEEYNKTAAEPLKNARNGVAGAIRNLDPKITATRNLDIVFYHVNFMSDDGIVTSQKDMIEFLRREHFLTDQCDVYSKIESVIQAIEAVDRDKLDFLIDGMVLKVNHLVQRDGLGYTEKFPKWAIAYKFKAEEMTTVLEDVIWNVGRTGKITPLAVLQPVDLCGATVSRATLNNMADIERKGVGIGDRVFVRRSNEVIPEIRGVAESFPHTVLIQPPAECPSCKTPLIKGNVHIFCPNAACPPQIIAKLEYFCSKDCMDIEGISEATAKQLHEQLGIVTPDALYTLTKKQLLTLDGFQSKKADNILSAIEQSKTVPLHRLISALAIPTIGKKTSKDLSKTFRSIEALFHATEDELTAIDEIGSIMALSIIDYFQKNAAFVNRLLTFVTPVMEEVGGALLCKKLVLTGTLPTLKRSDAIAMIEKSGGVVGSSVTKDTDYLVIGDGRGSKYDKAVKIGVKMIDEKELIALMQNASVANDES